MTGERGACSLPVPSRLLVAGGCMQGWGMEVRFGVHLYSGENDGSSPILLVSVASLSNADRLCLFISGAPTRRMLYGLWLPETSGN